MQNLNLRRTSDNIWKTSRQFDLDTSEGNSYLDHLVSENILQKGLTNDSLYYVEGSTYSGADILSR